VYSEIWIWVCMVFGARLDYDSAGMTGYEDTLYTLDYKLLVLGAKEFYDRSSKSLRLFRYNPMPCIYVH